MPRAFLLLQFFAEPSNPPSKMVIETMGAALLIIDRGRAVTIQSGGEEPMHRIDENRPFHRKLKPVPGSAFGPADTQQLLAHESVLIRTRLRIRLAARTPGQGDAQAQPSVAAYQSVAVDVVVEDPRPFRVPLPKKDHQRASPAAAVGLGRDAVQTVEFGEVEDPVLASIPVKVQHLREFGIRANSAAEIAAVRLGPPDMLPHLRRHVRGAC
jgi:hypothetical protein